MTRLRLLTIAVVCTACDDAALDEKAVKQCNAMISWAQTPAESTKVLKTPPNGITYPSNRYITRGKP